MKKGCAILLILAACIAAAAFFFGPQLVETGLRFLYPSPTGSWWPGRPRNSAWRSTWSTR